MIVANRLIGVATIVVIVDDDDTAPLVGTTTTGHDVRVVCGEGIVTGKIKFLLLSLIMNL